VGISDRSEESNQKARFCCFKISHFRAFSGNAAGARAGPGAKGSCWLLAN
jgi:hypothetical protein